MIVELPGNSGPEFINPYYVARVCDYNGTLSNANLAEVHMAKLTRPIIIRLSPERVVELLNAGRGL